MKLLAAFAISATVLAAQSSRTPVRTVSAVRHWSLTDITRVAVEVSGEFEFRTERLHNPERVYYDILNSRPHMDPRRTDRQLVYREMIGDKLVGKLRVAETLPGVTRVVLELMGSVEASTSQLTNPDRLIIELRPGPPTPPAVAPVSPLPSVVTPPVTPDPPSPPDVKYQGKPPLRTITEAPATLAPLMKPQPPEAAAAASKPAIRPLPPATTTTTTTAAARTDKLLEETSKAARKASDGNTSLVRALGLKFGRVVIDPGHGGHDQGTQGPKGLLEKDLVLDVGLRLGKLVEERLGREVVYTRKDDTFVPLEGRTAFAEDQRADLFVSIHANSSPVPRISGVETYYLNFTNSKDAIDVASRENASSQKSISQMTDILQTIGKHEKAEESREFAGKIQESLYAFSARTLPGTKDRGVKKAPFVVLIGAKIPSVLVEIGFLSNPREEALLRKPDYRQKLAEALYRGIARYADGLSHFQVAKAGKDE
jgi:N-acetylmuramoyl-L-alanine amidase